MLKWANASFTHEIPSPDGQIKCTFSLKNDRLTYLVTKNDKIVVQKSRLGLKISGEEPLENLRLVRTTAKKHAETIELPWGEDQFIKNNYSERTFYLAEAKKPERLLTLKFRVFDNAVAFRYEIPIQPKFRRVTIADELTEFNIDPNATAWSIPAYQPDRYEYNYQKSRVANLKNSVHTPLTIKNQKIYLSLHEAALYNYGSMTLKLNARQILQSDITPLSDHTRAHVDLPFHTPWRLIMLADSAIELTKNRVMHCLNDPPKKDFSWVKTLKFIGIWWAMYVGEWTWAPGPNHGATTAHAKEYIKAAVKLGISGLLIEGWNEGWQGDWLENGAENNFTTPTADFDLPAVARFAESHDVELVGHHETVGFVDNYEKQLNAAYNYYAANGIHYVKTGYAGPMMQIRGRTEYHHSQVGVNHYQKTVELAAKKHLCLDIHEPIKGTGIERTWPNLLSREGARGQEYEGGSLSPSHACILPYTRLLSGGMDYTSGIFDLTNSVKRPQTTLARQLAYFVTIYSGMVMAADRPAFYEKYPRAFEFIRQVPTNFAKTLPLEGEIGEHYIVARKDRASDDWFIGGVTAKARPVRINLNFLEPDTTYLAEIYADAPDAHYLNNPLAIKISQRSVDNYDKIDLYMAEGGGCAIHLRKIS